MINSSICCGCGGLLSVGMRIDVVVIPVVWMCGWRVGSLCMKASAACANISCMSGKWLVDLSVHQSRCLVVLGRNEIVLQLGCRWLVGHVCVGLVY